MVLKSVLKIFSMLLLAVVCFIGGLKYGMEYAYVDSLRDHVFSTMVRNTHIRAGETEEALRLNDNFLLDAALPLDTFSNRKWVFPENEREAMKRHIASIATYLDKNTKLLTGDVERDAELSVAEEDAAQAEELDVELTPEQEAMVMEWAEAFAKGLEPLAEEYRQSREKSRMVLNRYLYEAEAPE